MPYNPLDRIILDPELVRLRLEWVTAYKECATAAGEALATPPDVRRAAFRRYRTAEFAYFSHRQMLVDTEAS
jgi:hypothetical protein